MESEWQREVASINGSDLSQISTPSNLLNELMSDDKLQRPDLRDVFGHGFDGVDRYLEKLRAQAVEDAHGLKWWLDTGLPLWNLLLDSSIGLEGIWLATRFPNCEQYVRFYIKWIILTLYPTETETAERIADRATELFASTRPWICHAGPGVIEDWEERKLTNRQAAVQA